MQTWVNIVWKIRQKRPLILEMSVSLCLAFLIWLYAHSRAQDTLDNVLIPVSLQLASNQRDQYELDIQGPRQVTVTFDGASSRIRELRRLLQRGLVKAVIPCSVPEAHQKDSRFCDKIQVEAGHIAVPPGVRMALTEDGSQLQVTFHRIVERQLPVRLEHSADVRVRPIRLEPPMVTVRGPQEVLDRARFVPTQPYSFVTDPDAAVEESVMQGQVDLVSEMSGRPIQTRPERVSFTCRVQPKQKIYELANVPVLFLCPPGFPWRPSFPDEQAAKVTLRIMGPPGDEVPPVQAYLDLSKGDFSKGRNLAPIRVQMPRDFQLVPQSPQMVSFVLNEPG